MPKCKNVSNRYFKGTESSPKGLGWCASGMKIGTVKKGNDNKKWIIRKISNGNKKWFKLQNNLNKSKMSSLDKLQSKELQKKLKKIGIKVFVYKNKLMNDYWIQNMPWNYVHNKLGENYLDEKFIIIVLKIQDSKTVYLGDGGIYIQHNNITYKIKKQLQNIMKEEFGNKYTWSGKNSHALFVKF